MKNIGIFHYKIGGTDGVSLEINKWKSALESLGHQVHLAGGDLGSAQGTLIKEMFHHIPEAERLYFNTFRRLRDYAGNDEYKENLYKLVKPIEEKLQNFIEEKKIDLLIPENVWSVAANPAVAIAATKAIRDRRLPALAHHHDFYWERYEGVALTCRAAVELADKFLPPRDELVTHVVINSLAKDELKARKGVEAQVVPNVFEFNGDTWEPDDFNADFRRRIGLRETDIFILQATRVVSRKGIELATDLVAALNAPERRAKLKANGLYDGRTFSDDSRIVLVLAGYAQDDLSGRYLVNLKKRIRTNRVDALFIDHLVAGKRQKRAGRKRYSLWDTYVFADFVTYPSLWEGWGNQLLEAVHAKLPVAIFEYPVYQADIKNKGFRFVSLGAEVDALDKSGLAILKQERIEQAADEVLEYLMDDQLRREVTEHNYSIGKQYFSLEALSTYLEPYVISQ
jgi:glycosyltransferase involved in cell wall biosynthesis